MVFKSFKVVTFEQFLDGFEDDNSDFGSEFEGLKGGNRMMSLVTLFGGLKNVFKVKTYSTDTFVFRLHYKVTMGMMLACCLLITAIQLVTDPITCDVKGVAGGIFNAFCWTHATFTLPYRQFQSDGPLIQPGVGPLKAGHDPQQEQVYHGFYQWVGMALFVQALTFYVPHFLWKTWEGKKVERLVSGIISPVASEDVKRKHIAAIAEYFYYNRRRHVLYGIRFVLCEIMNLVNVSLQIFLIDRLLGGEFSTYGLQVLSFAMLDDEERLDPMVRIFPKVTKCTFHNFGQSGTIQKFDGLCILPINMINDKIYIGIWFWLFLLLLISLGYMVYRISTLASPRVRIAQLKSTSPSLTYKTCQFLRSNLGFGDWLILSMMSQHLDIKLFTEILKEIKEVSFKNQRSVSTNIDIFGASDTDREEDFIPGDRAELKPPPITPLSRSPRGSSRANSFKKISTTANLVGQLGIDPLIIQEMISDGYDPTQMAEWQQFRNQTIGDSEMLSCQNKVGADPEEPPRMRLNSDAFF